MRGIGGGFDQGESLIDFLRSLALVVVINFKFFSIQCKPACYFLSNPLARY